MSTHFDVIIVGAGPVGASLASLLARGERRTPCRVAVVAPAFESAPADEEAWDLRVFALSRASQRILEATGAWRLLAPGRRLAYERMRVWDESTAPRSDRVLTFDCAELGEPDLGHIVEGRALQNACVAAARGSGLALIEGGVGRIVAEEMLRRVELEDGRRLTCHLLVGADGTDSTTRRLLGIETAGHTYAQDALVAHVRTERPHENTAWQRFLRTGPLAFLPLPDGRSSIVWSADRATSGRLKGLGRRELGEALTEASDRALGACEITTPAAQFPLRLQYATSYVRAGAALVGDAAHVVHPLAGQGLNLGLMDSAVLAEALEDASEPARLGELGLLRRYERRRRGENLVAAAALDGIERLFAASGTVSAGLRGAALKTANRLPFVKSGLARRAMGLAGDVPEWLKH